MALVRSSRILLTAAATLAAGLSAGAALAATTWTVTPGGLVTASAGTTSLKDTTTGTAITCTSSRLGGILKSGSGLPGAAIGSISAVSFSRCTGPGGLAFTLTATDLPWLLNVNSFNSGTGVASGTISHIQIHLSASGCTAVIDGTSASASDGVARIAYGDGTGKLKARASFGGLHFYDVTGCAGLFASGDGAALSATWALTPRQTITSP
jgi:hypothetical protein